MILRKSVAAEEQFYRDKLLNAGITETSYGKTIWDSNEHELRREWERYEEDNK